MMIVQQANGIRVRVGLAFMSQQTLPIPFLSSECVNWALTLFAQPLKQRLALGPIFYCTFWQRIHPRLLCNETAAYERSTSSPESDKKSDSQLGIGRWDLLTRNKIISEQLRKL